MAWDIRALKRNMMPGLKTAAKFHPNVPGIGPSKGLSGASTCKNVGRMHSSDA